MIAEVAGIFNTLIKAGDVYDNYQRNKETLGKGTAGALAYGEVVREMLLKNNGGSMGKLLSRFIIEPTIFVTPDVKRNTHCYDLINKQLDIFTSYFVNSFQVLMNHYGLEHQTTLTAMGTGGGEMELALSIDKIALDTMNSALVKNLTTESFSDTLTNFYGSKTIASFEASGNGSALKGFKGILKKIGANLQQQQKVLQVVKNNTKKSNNNNTSNNNNNNNSGNNSNNNRESTKGSKVDVLLGDRNFTPELEIYTRYAKITTNVIAPSGVNKDNRVELEIPIIIKANIVTIHPSEMVIALTPKIAGTDFFTRLEKLRSKQITLSEFLFASDLVKANKQNKLKDVNNMVGMLEKNLASAKAKVYLTGQTGFEKYYNMFLMTEDEAVSVTEYTRVNPTDMIGKEKFLEALYGFSVMVYDTEWDKVSIAIKDVGGVSTVDISKFKPKTKNEDLSALLQSMIANQAPRW